MDVTKSRSILEVIHFVQQLKCDKPDYSKNQLASATAEEFELEQTRKVFHCPEFSIRFSTATGSSFSNTVLALSTLRSYDKKPFIVCIVRPKETEFLLANSTFLRKISHSSHQLRVDNVKGSFLGHDIIRVFNGMQNRPDNFEKLFAVHVEFSWDENLLRLVEATTAIAPTGNLFEPSQKQAENIGAAGSLAGSISVLPEYLAIKAALDQIVTKRSGDILRAAAIDNINERGNAIEQIITSSSNAHAIQDLLFPLREGARVYVDIKTKLLNLASSPKGYNIDKFLELLSKGEQVLSFFFVGIDLSKASIATSLVSVLDETILRATRIQFHWAGRNSRGVTQLTGDISRIFVPGFRENIDHAAADAFVCKLLNIRK